MNSLTIELAEMVDKLQDALIHPSAFTSSERYILASKAHKLLAAYHKARYAEQEAERKQGSN